jgi:hypothetical protein
MKTNRKQVYMTFLALTVLSAATSSNSFGADYKGIDLTPSGFVSSCAETIDCYGNIVGYSDDSSCDSHAILWQPIPEPVKFLLLSLSAAILRKIRLKNSKSSGSK